MVVGGLINWNVVFSGCEEPMLLVREVQRMNDFGKLNGGVEGLHFGLFV